MRTPDNRDLGEPQLMPRGVKPRRRARDEEMDRSERERATLEGELDALDQDIAAARAGLRRITARGWLGLGGRRAAAPRPRGERVRLADGAEILIRPIEPDDVAELKRGFEHLGALSRYRRFLAPIDRLSPAQLNFLTHVDHRSHEAIVAADALSGEGVGIARYRRDPEDPTRAEVAVVVADDWQRRGVGTALLERLRERGRANGLERFTARLLVGNKGGRALIERFGVTEEQYREGGLIDVTAHLRR
jgi:RimJ/RimL family protein N-acetyltransferase